MDYGATMNFSKPFSSCLYMATVVFFTGVGPARAEVDLSLRPVEDFARVGETIAFELVATSTTGSDESIASLSVIVDWDADSLTFVDALPSPEASWMVLGILPDPDGVNTFLDDGDAIVTGLAFPGSLVQASPEGTVISLLEFEGINRAASASILIPPQIGNFGETLVSEDPGENKVGQLNGSILPIAECGVPDSDFDGNTSLVEVSEFEDCFLGVDVMAEGLCACVFDLDDDGAGDGDVDLADWAVLSIEFSKQRR